MIRAAAGPGPGPEPARRESPGRIDRAEGSKVTELLVPCRPLLVPKRNHTDIADEDGMLEIVETMGGENSKDQGNAGKLLGCCSNISKSSVPPIPNVNCDVPTR
eukprot:502735-Hanusia_phi.AAC.2